MKLTNEFIEKLCSDFHYELTREQLEQDWVFDKKPFYKEKNAWCFRAPDNSWIEIHVNDVEDAFVGGVDFESLYGDGNDKVEELCNTIQNWVVKEFSPKIEEWVKEYMNDKRTPLHISDFCADDSEECGEEKPVKKSAECEKITELVKKKMGTVEPEWCDEYNFVTKVGSIQDNALAFIYGAIKKYGQDPEYFEELKDYIIREAEYIGK